MTPEYFIIPFLMNQINHIGNLSTGIYLLDTLLVILTTILFFTIDFTDIKLCITKKLQLLSINKDISIILTSNKNFTSIKYSAIMYYISKLENPTIYRLRELVQSNWDDTYDNIIEKNSIYGIDQKTNFILDKDIYGSFSKKKDLKRENRDEREYEEYDMIKVYSKNKTLKELIKWIETKVVEYNKYLRSKTSNIQLLINISNGNSNKNELVVEGIPWESTITFNNSYLRNQETIINQIDFFLNNKSWYSEKGIPYNLGILLYGEPGCGKTRFIKQLMNHTGRHGIDIKLNNNIDFNEIKKIIYNDNIGDEYIVPQDKRIIIFEDIDAIGDVVKDRNIKDTLEDELCKLFSDDSKNIKNISKDDIVKNCKKNNNNNNLSFFLNIIDGLNECCGRIIIMTTNRIEYLDKALIRPGRIDMKVEFKKCDTFDIYNMIKMFWKVDIKYNMVRKELNYKYTSAEVIEIFRSTNNFNDIKDIFIE